mgnify:CR=1 FL=1
MSHPGIVYLDENSPSQPPHRPRGHRASRCCSGFNGVGILGCLMLRFGGFAFGIASPLGSLISLLALRRGPRFAAWSGTLLGAVGTAFLALWGWAAVAAFNAVEYEQQQDQTEVVMEQAVASIEQFHREHKMLPEGVDGNKLLIAADLNDAWGQSLRYDPIDDDEYLIRSAGPDQKFDTSDDLTLQ